MNKYKVAAIFGRVRKALLSGLFLLALYVLGRMVSMIFVGGNSRAQIVAMYPIIFLVGAIFSSRITLKKYDAVAALCVIASLLVLAALGLVN